jgi:PII-like signaling protein
MDRSAAVSEDYLKLTSYFGERLRHQNHFVADALLDLYGSSSVATSVILRGIASFGPRHLLRGDETLSMSEDLPVAVAAVDTARKIAGLAEQAIAMTPRGFVTLERARLVGRSAAAPTPDAAKLTIYIGRQHRSSGQPAHRAVCDLLFRNGFAAATVLLGLDGTAHGQRHRARFFSRNTDVPLMVIAIGTADQVDRTIPEVESLLTRPLLTVERAQLCKRDGHLVQRPSPLPRTDGNGLALWQKLMIYTSESALYEGVPIHRAIVRRLRDSNAASGATVLRGLWGFHNGRKPHGDKLFQLTRQVPVVTIVIDTPDRIAGCFAVVDTLTSAHGLVTSEMVPAVVSIDGGQRRGGAQLAQQDY